MEGTTQWRARSLGWSSFEMKIHLGTVGHFGLAVRNPHESAKWWQELFDLVMIFHGEDYVGLTNDAITIVLVRGEPSPQTIEHVSFHVDSMKDLEQALDELKRHHVEVEDPGDEIGPEAPGSPNLGLWFHDPDGYRWELSLLGGAREGKR
jgi:catechol 2,3-dioxygenase-like lactoylglutathione lyase family enzyme